MPLGIEKVHGLHEFDRDSRHLSLWGDDEAEDDGFQHDHAAGRRCLMV